MGLEVGVGYLEILMGLGVVVETLRFGWVGEWE